MEDLEVTEAQILFSELIQKVEDETFVVLGQFTDEFLALISEDDQGDRYLFPWLSSRSDNERNVLVQAAHRNAFVSGQLVVSDDGLVTVGPEIELLGRLRNGGRISRIILENNEIDAEFFTLLHYWHGSDFVLQEIVREDGIHDLVACTATRAMDVILNSFLTIEEDDGEPALIFSGPSKEFGEKREELIVNATKSAFVTFMSEDETGLSQFEVLSNDEGYLLLHGTDDPEVFEIESVSIGFIAALMLHYWFGGSLESETQ